MSSCPRIASLLVLLSGFSLSACVSDTGTLLSEAATAKTEPQAVSEAVSPIAVAAVKDDTVRATDRKIAEREMRQAAESGTVSGSAAIDRLIEKHAEENGIPTELAYAVVRVESRYNPKAKGAGVYGLSQIKPATARSLGFAGSASDLFDPDTNLTYGMKYLKGAWEKSGHSVCGTAMKYKGGHRASRMTRSASAYCSKLKANMAALAKRRGAPALAVPATTEVAALAVPASPAPRDPKAKAEAVAETRAASIGVPRKTDGGAEPTTAPAPSAAATTLSAAPVTPSAVAPSEPPAAASAPDTAIGAGDSPATAGKGGRVSAASAEPDSARFGG